MNLQKNPNAVWLAALALIIAAGCWLRWPSPDDAQVRGFDESIYVRYTKGLNHVGLFGFPALCEEYLSAQKQARHAFLPPTRVLFLACTTIVSQITGLEPLEAIRTVSAIAACLALMVTAIFAWRLGGPGTSLGVTALMACAPTQIHMAHRALVDGFFGMLALVSIWALWECLQKPNHRGWLALYAAAIAAMVLTKENAFFVYVAICGILLINYFRPMGTATRPLYITTLVAPAVGALLLVAAAGGPATLIGVFRLNIEMSMVLPYAIATGDGPWHRYLLDFLTVSPAILILGIASLGHWRAEDRAKLFLVLFIGITYAMMCQVKYGMNMRYGNMWDMPLRWLVISQLAFFTLTWKPAIRRCALPVAVAALCAAELWQYSVLFDVGQIYDPIPSTLLPALKVLK